MKKYLLLFLSMLTTLCASAYDYQYNGVYYDLDNVNETATVTYASTSYGSYSGAVNIPDYITTAKGMDYDVIAIGPNAFRGSTGLTKVTISTGIETIAENAFYGCSGLTELKIPNTVTSLGEGAFRGCSKVASVTFSSRLTSLPNYCFYGCSALKTITLPKNLATLGTYCFQGCSSLSSVSFSTILTNIADYCFNSCSALTNITLPASVQNVGPYAFQNCGALDNIKLNEGLLRLGDYALANCPKLTEVTLPATVANVGTNLFYQDTALSNAQLSASQLTTLPTNTFSGCSALSIVSLPATLTTIGESAFSGCSKLPNLTFPAKVSSVASNAFNSCSNLKQLTFAEGMTTIPRTYDSYVTNVVIPASANAFSDSAFEGCNNLITISLPAVLASIGNRSFYGCSSLTALLLPASVQSIGTDAFTGCTNLTDLTYAEGTRTALRSYATKLTKVTIPSTCTALADGIFDGCSSLTQVYLSDLEVWNYLFSQRTSTPFACPRYIYLNGEMLTDLIADFGAPVANYAFSNVKGLKNVTLTATVTGVGDYAFTNSTDLQNVVMGANVRTVGKSAFSGCNSLESVRLGSGVTSLGNNAFYGCTSLNSMRMGGSEQTLGTSVFEGCTALQNITLPATVKTIGASAFKDCKTLTAVNIPQGVSAIQSNTFSGCLALPAITVPASVTSVGTSAFYGCAKLDQITLPDAVTTIGDNAFSQCVALNYATVGRGIKSIGSAAFGNCTMLKGFYCLATAVPTTNSNAFNGSDPTSIKLYVPDESASAYAAKSPWNQFASAIGLSEAPVYAAEITLTPEVLILSDDYEDEDFIRYTVSPANATNGKVTWQSSNTSVATVSRSGLVSPVAEGVATITCTASDKHGARATALVIIANDFRPVSSIALDHNELTLTEGEKLQLVPTTQPADATYDVITWLTSDPNVATVNEAGEVVAVNAGTCTITAQTSDGTKLRAVCALTVKAPTYASLSTYGDVSGDGLVTSDDIQSIVELVLGQHGGVDNYFDVNQDGHIGVGDLAAIVAAYQNQSEMPCGPLKALGVNANSYNIIVGDSRTITTTLVPFRAGSHVSWTTSDEQLIRLGSATGDKCTFTALAPGQATITAAANDGTGFSATITVNIEPNTLGTTDGYTWVDLGLPSGTRWATCNIGATLPEHYGDYIAWGELDAKTTYDWTTYTLCGGNATSLTKYCTASANGKRDDKRTLEAADDAAAQRWSSQWALPTREQMAELFDSANTTSTWTTQGGVYGRKVTSKVNGSSIFLPAAGNKSEYGLNSEKTGGYYATRDLADPSTKAYGLNFGESTITLDNLTFRSVGQSIRPVLAPSVSLSANQLQLVVGEHYNAASLLTFSEGTTPALTWSSNNPQVASVSASGEVTALTAGTASIYATTGDGLTASIKLTVDGELKITASKSTIYSQETLQLSVNTSSPITWSSSDPSVASVTADGLVTGVAYGSATITATLLGGQKSEMNLTVKKPIVEYPAWTSSNHSNSSTSSHTYTISYDKNDILDFDWSVSSEAKCDFLIVTLDGSEILKKSGTDSGHYTKTFTTSGTATLIAKYTKDSSISNGDDQGRIYNMVLTKNGGGLLPPSPSVNDETRTFTVNGVTFNMKLVEHGTFQMGSTSGDSDEKPVHSVTISNDYYIGETEVTQGLWYAVMGRKPTSDGDQWKSSYGLGDNYPAYYISWNDCQTFITKLNAATGQTFRMPTEAEWEFAAKGGNKSQGYTYSGSNTIGDVAWYKSNSSSKTHPVATKQPNELGIYDMSGNVWEWCSDWYGSYTSSAVTDPTGPTSGSYRVKRGGSWYDVAALCRTANRDYVIPTSRVNFFGLRLALSPSMASQGPDDSGTDNQWSDANGHEYVDLGLPSGTLWATCNVGAETPEDYGYYFAWGETEPKSTYNCSTLKYCLDSNGNKFSKYVASSSYGTVDNKTELDLEDDAAYMNRGEGWRMPSLAQQDELCDTNNCTWTWTNINGKNGYLVKSKRNDSSLFLPAAGNRDEGSLYYAGSGGLYWSRSLNSNYSNYAYYLIFNSDGVGWYYHYRDYGFSVRPVRVSGSE